MLHPTSRETTHRPVWPQGFGTRGRITSHGTLVERGMECVYVYRNTLNNAFFYWLFQLDDEANLYVREMGGNSPFPSIYNRLFRVPGI